MQNLSKPIVIGTTNEQTLLLSPLEKLIHIIQEVQLTVIESLEQVSLNSDVFSFHVLVAITYAIPESYITHMCNSHENTLFFHNHH